MPDAENRLSAFLYRYRGLILGMLALLLFLVTPSRIPGSFCINESTGSVFLAFVLYVLSGCLRVRARQYIGEHTRGKVHAADSLVTFGVYARIRHPLYVSNTGFALGFAFFHLGFSLWVFPFAVAVILFEVRLALIEDRFLERKFGDAWSAWASRVPPFIPHIGSTVPNVVECDGGSAPIFVQRTFWQAFWADRSTWVWLLFFNFLLVLRKMAVFYV